MGNPIVKIGISQPNRVVLTSVLSFHPQYDILLIVFTSHLRVKISVIFFNKSIVFYLATVSKLSSLEVDRIGRRRDVVMLPE